MREIVGIVVVAICVNPITAGRGEWEKDNVTDNGETCVWAAEIMSE